MKKWKVIDWSGEAAPQEIGEVELEGNPSCSTIFDLNEKRYKVTTMDSRQDILYVLEYIR